MSPELAVDGACENQHGEVVQKLQSAFAKVYGHKAKGLEIVFEVRKRYRGGKRVLPGTQLYVRLRLPGAWRLPNEEKQIKAAIEMALLTFAKEVRVEID